MMKEKKVGNQKSDTNQQIKAIAITVIIFALVIILWAVGKGIRKAQNPVLTPVVSESKSYDAYPEMTIDQTKQYFATFKMEKGGEFVVQLFADKAPLAVNSFVFLAKDGYFNGVTFHRVLDGFVAQGGDPTGTGMGGPGYQFVNESSDLTFDKPGVMAMANAGAEHQWQSVLHHVCSTGKLKWRLHHFRTGRQWNGCG